MQNTWFESCDNVKFICWFSFGEGGGMEIIVFSHIGWWPVMTWWLVSTCQKVINAHSYVLLRWGFWEKFEVVKEILITKFELSKSHGSTRGLGIVHIFWHRADWILIQDKHDVRIPPCGHCSVSESPLWTLFSVRIPTYGQCSVSGSLGSSPSFAIKFNVWVINCRRNRIPRVPESLSESSGLSTTMCHD